MFRNRADAGQRLAARLTEFVNRDDVLVMGLLRGGVPVAFEIAHALHAPLDVLLVRKLGAPGQPELAMGAVAAGGIRILDRKLIQSLGLSHQELDNAIVSQETELRRREQLYNDVRPKVEVRDRIVILADDGIATGASMLAAVAVLRSQQPKKIVVAVPVAPPHAPKEMEQAADRFLCLQIAGNFPAVGAFYGDFSQVEDQEVRRVLLQAARFSAKSASGG
jgi:putative phosphoribosyl transferase